MNGFGPTSPRVLVTGGTGFIGRHVVARFLSAGWDVTNFSLPGEPPAREWQRPVRMVPGDLADPHAVAQAAHGAALLIHLAAVVALAGEYERQWAIIVDGTRRVCEAVAAQGGRLVVVSSVAVYGDLIQRHTCREEDGFGAWQGAYGRAKQGQETAAQDVAGRMGVPLTLVRPANVYGLGGASAFGDRLIAALRANGGAVFGDAETNDAGLVYVENLADALFLAGVHEAAIGQTYNICDELGVSWRRFFDDMAGLADVSPPPALPLAPVWDAVLANEDPAALVPPRDPNLPFREAMNLVGFSNRFDSGRIRRELGWLPRVGYAEAMAEMAATINTPP